MPEGASTSESKTIMDFATAAFLFVGIGLAILACWFRWYSGGKFEVKATELILLVLPVAIWLVAAGRIGELNIGTGGMKLKSVVQKSTAKAAALEARIIKADNIVVRSKDDFGRLLSLKREHPQALSLKILRKNSEYYDEMALREYIYQLSELPDFKYFLFFGSTPTEPFIGGILSSDLCRALNPEYPSPATWEQTHSNPAQETGGSSFTTEVLTNILNGNEEQKLIVDLPGFIKRDKALKKTDIKKKALERMAEMETTWLPVTENTGLVGIVERSAITTSIVLDIANALG